MNKSKQGKIKIIDLATTMQGAFRLLKTRVKKINESVGFHNIIVCPEDKEDIVFEKNHDIIPIKVHRRIGIWQTVREIISVRKVLTKIRPNIIHTHNSKAGAIGRITAFLVNLFSKEKIIVIHQVHGYYFNALRGYKKIIFIIIEYMLALISDVLLFQNGFEYNQSRRLCMHWVTKLVSIGNGIDFDEFLPIHYNNKRPDNPYWLICIARVEPVKNHRMLIQALEYLVTTLHFTDFICYCIGEITDTTIVAFLESTKALPFMRFTGSLPRREIKNYLMKASLSLLTSYKEGMPRSIMESMLLGVPCLCTDVVGTNELVKNGINGYLVKLHDYKALAYRIKNLCENKSEWEKLSKNSWEYAIENFNEDHIVETLKKIYIEVLHIKGDRKDKSVFENEVK